MVFFYCCIYYFCDCVWCWFWSWFSEECNGELGVCGDDGCDVFDVGYVCDVDVYGDYGDKFRDILDC